MIDWDEFFSRNSSIKLGNRLGVQFMKAQDKTRDILTKEYVLSLKQEDSAISCVVWDAGSVLVDYMGNMQWTERKYRVLDVGTGTGVCGLCAYILGAESVVLTDIADSNVLRSNISYIKEIKPNLNPSSNIEFCAYNWRSPSIPTALASYFDIILCSDVLYESSVHNDLFAFLRQLKFETLLLSYKVRHVDAEKAILKELNALFSMEEVDLSTVELRNLTTIEVGGLHIFKLTCKCV